MSEEVLTALIAAAPPTLAAVLGFMANRRSIRRSVGASPSLPLTKWMERLEHGTERLNIKLDELSEGQAQVRERLARLETRIEDSSRSPR
jgi:hypothetical protein